MDTWQLITNRMTELNELHKRMDKTKELVYMEPQYELKNFRGQKMSNVIHVTSNKASKLGTAIVSDLIGVKWQDMIEGKLTQRQSHVIEEFIQDNFDQVDEYLFNKFGFVNLYTFLCNHVCIRGPIGAEYVSWIEGDKYKITCQPLDMRWTAFEYGQDGLEWGAGIFWNRKEQLEKEFPEQKDKIKSGVDIEVRDYWDKETHEIWIDKTLVKQENHRFGVPPLVFAFPPSGFLLRDKGYLKHEAEDLFFLNRLLYEEENRLLSIHATLGFEILEPAIVWPEESPGAEPAPKRPQAGQGIKRKKGEEPVLFPRDDMSRAALTSRQDIQRMIDEGGPILPRQYTQPPSALEVQTEAGLLAKLLNPRLEALRVFREQSIRMMIDQFIQASKAVGKEETQFELGIRGRKRQYSPSQLKDPDTYTISCKALTKTKEQEIANIAEFAAVYGRLPLRYNLTNILMAEDPDGIMREKELEEAEQADPALKLHEMALRFVEEAEDLEDDDEANAKLIQAKMLMERGVRIIKDRLAPAQPALPESARVPKVEEQRGSMQSLIPLLGRGGTVGGRPGAREETITPEEV